MMVDGKTAVRFICQNCGFQSLRWLGKCPGCNEWNTLLEEVLQFNKEPVPKSEAKAQKIGEINAEAERRKATGINEFDRILGGGIVSGSLVLIGGEPGIGKSTLLLQVCSKVSKVSGRVLYVSGEESLQQIKMRAERLGVTTAEEFYLLTENNFENVKSQIKKLKPRLVVIDSIQIIYNPLLSASPGSISQIKEVTTELMYLAKNIDVPVFIVGHVTKDGSIAGPKVLEHIVDTVLYFEGEKHHNYRILRTVKNRFGATNEIGIFEMTSAGLQEVSNPSRFFLEERSGGKVGSVAVACLEGSRPLLVELQALTVPTSFGMPRRTSEGFDYQRLLLLIAVLEKKEGFHLHSQDVFINIAGGVKADEPAADLGLILALTSGFKNIPVPAGVSVFGEVGLGGEVRGVNQAEARVKEAVRLGFKKIIMPRANFSAKLSGKETEIYPVEMIKEAIELLF